jgi:hypothetical protein
MHRRRGKAFAEAPGEVAAAHAGDRRQRLDIPVPARLRMQRGQRLSELRIGERDQFRGGLLPPALHAAHVRQGAQDEVVRARFELDDATDNGRYRLVLVLRLLPKVRTLASLRRAAELVPLRVMEEQQVVLAEQHCHPGFKMPL